jgi:hypothetical protein
MTDYLLLEINNYILQENGDKIILQEGTSISPSGSISPSASVSPSISMSPSSSVSASKSPSASFSPSISESPSPSEGYSLYSRGTIDQPYRYKYGGISGIRYKYGQHLRYGGTLGIVVDDTDLSHIYTEQEETEVATVDTNWVGQPGSMVYMLHKFKSFVDDRQYCSVEWMGKSTLAPSLSAVYLQIYNRTTGLWDTLDTNNTSDEDLDFELEGRVPNLTNYKNISNVISCRVYQLAI